MSTHWALCLIHFLYTSFMTIAAWLRRHTLRQPKPLQAQRSKVPKHLCLNLVANNDMAVEETEAAFLECLQRVATWCRVKGIEILTVYDRHGVLHRCSENARRRVFLVNETSEDSCESEVEYPLTPPPSESSDSRSHSPEHVTYPADLNVVTMRSQSRPQKRRNVAVRRQPKNVSSISTLYIASRAAGKPAIVSASRSLLRSCAGGGFERPFTVSQLGMMLEAGLPSPDFMIIHHIEEMGEPQRPIELYGFPPWQSTLSEFHRTRPDDGQENDGSPVLISETAFRRALDEYAGAEFRRGR